MDDANIYNPIVSQPLRRLEVQFGETSVGTVCSYCQNKIVTRIEYVNGNLTFLTSAVICGLG